MACHRLSRRGVETSTLKLGADGAQSVPSRSSETTKGGSSAVSALIQVYPDFVAGRLDEGRQVAARRNERRCQGQQTFDDAWCNRLEREMSPPSDIAEGSPSHGHVSLRHRKRVAGEVLRP